MTEARVQPSLSHRVIASAGYGIALGVLLVVVGIVRAVVFLLTGGSLESLDGDELRGLAFYVGSFGVGGAIFGALRFHRWGKVGTYAGCMLVGTIVMFAIGAADEGGIGALDRLDWIALTTMGLFFGAAAAFGWNRAATRSDG